MKMNTQDMVNEIKRLAADKNVDGASLPYELLQNAINETHEEVDRTNQEFDETFNKLSNEDMSMIDYFTKMKNSAIENKDYEQVNRLNKIIYQLEDVETFCHISEMLNNKPKIAILSEKFLENKNKEIEKANRRLQRHQKYTFKEIESFREDLNILNEYFTEDELDKFYLFMIKEINFMSLEKNGLFISKLMFNTSLLNKAKLSEHSENFKNNLINFIELYLSKI